MSEQHTSRKKIFLYVVLACLTLGIATGAVMYLVLKKPLPSFISGPSGSHGKQPATPTRPAITPAAPMSTAITPRPALSDEPGARQGREESRTTPAEQAGHGNTTPENALSETGFARDEPDTRPAKTGAILTGGNDEDPAGSQNDPPQIDNHAVDDAARPVEKDDGNNQSRGVLRYSKGYPAKDARSVYQGRIERDAPVAGTFADTMVGHAFIRDLAEFLVENYWPRKTHPLAATSGISTAGLRLLNMRYGAELTAFGLDVADHDAGRRQLLDYVFTPGMIRALYSLHVQNFLDALEGAANMRTTEHGPLSDSQCAELFAIYGKMAANLAGCIKAYQRTPKIRALVNAYADASTRAAADFIKYAEAVDGPSEARIAVTEQYRASILLREQEKENLAAAMRLGGYTTGLDADALVYTAAWLHRRGEGRATALNAAAEICADCSRRLLDLARLYRPER